MGDEDAGDMNGIGVMAMVMSVMGMGMVLETEIGMVCMMKQFHYLLALIWNECSTAV